MTEADEEQDECDQEANDVTGSSGVRQHEDANGERDDALDADHRPALPRYPGRRLPGYSLRGVLHPGCPYPIKTNGESRRSVSGCHHVGSRTNDLIYSVELVVASLCG